MQFTITGFRESLEKCFDKHNAILNFIIEINSHTEHRRFCKERHLQILHRVGDHITILILLFLSTRKLYKPSLEAVKKQQRARNIL